MRNPYLTPPKLSHRDPRFPSAPVRVGPYSAANGITTTVRSLGVSLGPTLAGYLLSHRETMFLPWILAGGLKIVYDLLLLWSFQAVQTDVEKKKIAAEAAGAAEAVEAADATEAIGAIDAIKAAAADAAAAPGAVAMDVHCAAEEGAVSNPIHTATAQWPSK